MTTLILAAALAAGAAAAPASVPAVQGELLNLSCIEALAAIGQPGLAGVFSFVSEKDSPAAFADLLVHDHKALKRYIEKVGQDLKVASGITDWDHEAVMFALAILTGPLAQTLEKPPGRIMSRLNEMSLAPKLSLEVVVARRKK